MQDESNLNKPMTLKELTKHYEMINEEEEDVAEDN